MKKTECTVLDIIFHIKDKIKEYDNDIERLNIPLRHLPEIQKKTLEEGMGKGGVGHHITKETETFISMR